jgi:DNA-binding MltR family transcriptional regulator
MPDLDKATSSLGDAINALRRQGHGSIVMQATAILEYDLERCLVRKFRPLNSELKKRLFDAYGPLSTFAAKIDLAFALDIMAEAAHKELHKMRKIRNAFAHSKKGLSLETEPIKALFYTLARPAGITGTYVEQFVKCVEVIDNELEAYLVSMGETEDVDRALKRKSASETPKEDTIPTEPPSPQR